MKEIYDTCLCIPGLDIKSLFIKELYVTGKTEGERHCWYHLGDSGTRLDFFMQTFAYLLSCHIQPLTLLGFG